MSEKLGAVDHLLFCDGGVLFGATILGSGRALNAAARALLALCNSKGAFTNREDDIDTLSDGLRRCFGRVDIRQEGLVALFRAS